jgi:tRNA nucleotidyltransferase (CCA-adding enzyme)
VTATEDGDAAASLTVYQVGGSVRDQLLGYPSPDRDFVVVGASPDIMIERGFRPVGRDFPVFLHPETHEEYALARTERKSGHGYRGFVFHAGPEVTLEEDLLRRDLTVNAMAIDAQGHLIDPFGGRLDLARQRLRHVSPAFVEDPLRVLRLARFATRFPEFSIAPATLDLCREMVRAGELDHLVPERVWQETRKALMHDQPSRYFDLLREVGALAVLFPEIDALFGVPQTARHHPEIDSGRHTLMVIDRAAELGAPLAVRYACLVHDLGKALTPAEQWPAHRGHEKRGLGPIDGLSKRLSVPGECRDLARRVGQFHLHAHRALELKASTILDLLTALDAFRKPEVLDHFLQACQADLQGRLGRQNEAYPQADYLRACFTAAVEVTAQPFLDQGLEGPAIAAAIKGERQRRIDRVRRSLKSA